MTQNKVILSVAGAGKTQQVVDSVVESSGEKVLVTTFTNRNVRELEQRLQSQGIATGGTVQVVPWMTFVMRHGVRPFQSSILGRINAVRKVFLSHKPPPRRKDVGKGSAGWYMQSSSEINSQRIADFAVVANEQTDGAVVKRLESIYDKILIDEFQDLKGFDLAIMELLAGSSIDLTIVGDLRQNVLASCYSLKNRKLSAPVEMEQWLTELVGESNIRHSTESRRCNQLICDVASRTHPGLQPLSSISTTTAAHHGIFQISDSEVEAYVREHGAVVLKYDKREMRALRHGAPNIGECKGAEFSHVVIYPTKSWRDFVASGFKKAPRSPDKLYVAMTRARHSVAFVID